MSSTGRNRRVSTRLAAAGAVAGAIGAVGLGTALPASAATSGFGPQVANCAGTTLPGSLNHRGSISMTMPDGSTMSFATFGAMVTYMQTNQMCS